MNNLQQRLDEAIRDVPDFPKPGILFKDITPVLEDPVLCRDIVAQFCKKFKGLGVDAIAGIESRGFLFGLPIAIELGIPFITVRKRGKLPYHTVSYEYDLEYGSAAIEVHKDSIQKDWNVMVHDDLLATGGTAMAAAELIKSQNANVVGFSFLIELAFLKGIKKLDQYSNKIVKLITF
ncbi:MAG: adenine phosphoribosyltransferase [Flavobacteriales bacterium]|nr:adenine phosphoribosyltransferase [Flavobacteriales bacterium]